MQTLKVDPILVLLVDLVELHSEFLSYLVHSAALCDRCMERIHGAWFRCVYCAKDLCEVCEALDTHDETHVFVVFKAPVNASLSLLVMSSLIASQVDMPRFRYVMIDGVFLWLTLHSQFANLENPSVSPPIIPFPVYF